MARYQLTREPGRGSMGVVHLAVRRDLERDVALELIRADVAHDQHAATGLVREARTPATAMHPDILRISDAGVLDGQMYYAMELLEGKDLLRTVDESGARPLARALPSISRRPARDPARGDRAAGGPAATGRAVAAGARRCEAVVSPWERGKRPEKRAGRGLYRLGVRHGE